jgi:type IV secretory pathway VirB2 component (pilin)
MSAPDPKPGFFSRPKVRMAIARVLVVIGIVLAAIAILTGRWGLLVAAIIIVGIGAAFGPARIRR